jgi:hypothetical protein
VISVLVVAPEGMRLEELEAKHPSVEVLMAHAVEDTLEKLGRNRRIDAVLLLCEKDARDVVAAIEEDNPAHPPLFQPAGPMAVPGARSLPAREPLELIDLLATELKS